jgi:hypothetical protein
MVELPFEPSLVILAGGGRMIQVFSVYEHITPALAVRDGCLGMMLNED